MAEPYEHPLVDELVRGLIVICNQTGDPPPPSIVITKPEFRLIGIAAYGDKRFARSDEGISLKIIVDGHEVKLQCAGWLGTGKVPWTWLLDDKGEGPGARVASLN